MSAGLFTQPILAALNTLGTRVKTGYVALLLAWPTPELSIDELQIVGPDLGNGVISLFGDWQLGSQDNINFISNVAPITFGAINRDVLDVIGWVAIADNAPFAWGPLVDSTGTQITRSFYAGDEVTFPAGALRIGLA